MLTWIADSHDLGKIDKVVNLLNLIGLENVLHAGDYCAPFVALGYGGLKAKKFGVFGNNDAERHPLRAKFEPLGHELRGEFANLEFWGAKIALLHGDDSELLQAIANSQAYDLVVSGHTYAVTQTMIGRTLILNPGEICGYLSGRSTIVTFETANRHVEILEV